MIYEIISKNDIPTSQMHIYLKNKTGDDGGIYPEIFNDLALTESVNGLYAFALACVLTNNFTDTVRFLKNYPSKEVATLALIQYMKGIATTVPLKNKCINPLYENLSTINQLGTSPTLLNLDGDLFYKHYDKEKYFSKEAADEAEDSFPYWVINVVKEIKDSTEIITPKSKTFELPYYIQNISSEYIPILNKRGKPTEDTIIGNLPPSGTEAIIDIKDGYGILASAETAYILLTDKVSPIKHVVTEEELNADNGTLVLPEGEFDVICESGVLIAGGYGTNNHYLSKDEYTYKTGDIIHIKKLFRNYGIIADGIYIDIHSDYVYIQTNNEEHTKLENDFIQTDNIAYGTKTESEILNDSIGPNKKYVVIIPTISKEVASNMVFNILKKSPYTNTHIVMDNGKPTVVVYGDDDSSNAIKVKKKILAVFGYKAMVIESDKFYK